MEGSPVPEKQDWHCGDCGKRFLTELEFQNHSINFDCGYDQCPKCEKYFKKTGIQLHKRSGCQQWICKICGTKFGELAILKAHQSTHTGENRTDCLKCGKSLCGKYYLKKHLETCSGRKFKKLNGKHLCDICGKSFPSKYRFSHFALCHRKLGLGHFRKQFKLDGTINCNFCEKDVLVRDYALHRHLELKPCFNWRRKNKPIVSCDKCDIKISLKNRNYHADVHQSPEEFKNEVPILLKDGPSCVFCGYISHSYSHLEKHIRKHTNERPFHCDLCDEAFPSLGNKNRHDKSKNHVPNVTALQETTDAVVSSHPKKQTQKKITKPKKFCEICKNFMTEQRFNRHFSYCGNPCRICGKKDFRSLSYRNAHIQAHSKNPDTNTRFGKRLLPKGTSLRKGSNGVVA